MSLSFVFERAEQISLGIWLVPMPPDELAHLGRPAATGPGRSVLVVSAPPSYDPQKGTLSIPAPTLIFKHQGNARTAEAVVISTAVSARKENIAPTPRLTNSERSDRRLPVGLESHWSDGDRKFVKAVSREVPALSEAGRELLHGVRKFSDGSLKPTKTRNQFVEDPENFWHVTVQPRNQALAIIVYGSPSDFSRLPNMKLKPRRRGVYSEFSIQNAAEVTGALKIIRQAYEAKTSKRRRSK